MGTSTPPSCVLSVPLRAQKEGSSYSFPPLDGTRAIPELFDWHFVENTNYPVFVFKDKRSNELKHLYYREFVPAIHEAGRYVANVTGTSIDDASTKHEPVAIIATTDTITFCCTMIGMLRAGIPIVPIAPVNSPEAAAHLMTETRSSRLLVSEDTSSLRLANAAANLMAERTKEDRPQILKMPTFSDIFLEGSPMRSLPTRNFDLSSPAIYVHSSGSTALPKPIIWTHAELLQTAASQCFGVDLRGEILGVQGLSMSHASGINHTIPFLCVAGYIAATLSPEENCPVRTPEAVMQSFLDCRPTLVICVPSYLQAWSEDPESVEFLKSLKTIGFGGGPLSKETGDSLVKQGVPLSLVYGSTEAGIVARYFPEVLYDDWEYFEINPQCAAEFAHVEGDLYELIVIKGPTQELPIVNTIYNGHEAYSTNDLLQKHPTRPNHWKIYGRGDDQITLVNGLKTNAGPIESIISRHPAVHAAVVFGRAQRNLGVIVFPKYHDQDGDHGYDFKARIWPTVEKVNKSGPKHAHIFKEMILVSSSSRPALMTEKGTVRRGATLGQYSDDLKELYDRFEASADIVIPAPLSWDLKSTLQYVRSVVCHVLGSIESDDQDIFDQGCASLQAFWIGNSILHSIGKTAPLAPRNFIYEHRTIKSIAHYTSRLARGADAYHSNGVDRRQHLSGFVKQFSDGLVDCANGHRRGDVVLVTGTTGSLGSYLLARLAASDEVRRIYALNRASEDGEPLIARQVDALEGRGLDGRIASSQKVILLQADFKRADLGLCPFVLQELRLEVTHIIHNAWPVNFNLLLNSFLDAMAGVRSLIDFALSAISERSVPPKFTFISSMGIFRHNTFSRNRVEERFVEDADSVSEQGYSESKWISEQVLATSARRTPLRPVVIRMDQITGGINGAWNTNEWFPVLVRTSVTIGVLPILHGLAHWISLQDAASVVLECRNSSQEVLHITHPQPVRLEFIIDVIARELDLPTCSYGEWIAKLEARASNLVDVEEAELLPALKAIDFFQGLKSSITEEVGTPPTRAEGKAVGESTTLRALASFTEVDVRHWIQFWKEVGFI